MSYARPGEDSDVYVWSDGKTLYCELGDGEREFPSSKFSTRSHQEMHDHLLMHRRRGESVPDAALERLWHEARGLPYETPVEAALRELRECPECRGEDGRHKLDCGHRPGRGDNVFRVTM
jgi:hypothetical protein